MNDGLITASTLHNGNAGNISILSGGVVTMNDARITTETNGQGDAGSITVNATDMTLANGANIRSATFGVGRGGDLIVTVADTLSLSGSGARGVLTGLFSSTLNQGAAGDIAVSTGNLSINDGGQINTESLNISSGNAGNIEVNVAEIARLTNGSIRAASGASQTDGGNITITANSLQVTRGSDVTASVFGNYYIRPAPRADRNTKSVLPGLRRGLVATPGIVLPLDSSCRVNWRPMPIPRASPPVMDCPAVTRPSRACRSVTDDNSWGIGGSVALVKTRDPVVLFGNLNCRRTFSRDFDDPALLEQSTCSPPPSAMRSPSTTP